MRTFANVVLGGAVLGAAVIVATAIGGVVEVLYRYTRFQRAIDGAHGLAFIIPNVEDDPDFALWSEGR